jgi:hypothetical protein
MKRVAPEVTESMIHQLQLEQGENLLIEGFTFHFVSHEERALSELSARLNLIGFHSFRLTQLRDEGRLVLELQRDGDLRLEALMRLDFVLSAICAKLNKVEYMGCTPIGMVQSKEEADWRKL